MTHCSLRAEDCSLGVAWSTLQYSPELDCFHSLSVMSRACVSGTSCKWPIYFQHYHFYLFDCRLDTDLSNSAVGTTSHYRWFAEALIAVGSDLVSATSSGCHKSPQGSTLQSQTSTRIFVSILLSNGGILVITSTQAPT